MEKQGDELFCLLPLQWDQAYSHRLSVPAPINNYFFVCCSPVGLVNASPFDFQSHPVQGTCSYAAVVKPGASELCASSFHGVTGDLEWVRESTEKVYIGFPGLWSGTQSACRCIRNKKPDPKEQLWMYANTKNEETSLNRLHIVWLPIYDSLRKVKV